MKFRKSILVTFSVLFSTTLLLAQTTYYKEIIQTPHTGEAIDNIIVSKSYKFAATSTQNEVIIWNLPQFTVKTTIDINYKVKSLSFNSNERLILINFISHDAFRSENDTINSQLYTIKTGEPVGRELINISSLLAQNQSHNYFLNFQNALKKDTIEEGPSKGSEFYLSTYADIGIWGNAPEDTLKFNKRFWGRSINEVQLSTNKYLAIAYRFGKIELRNSKTFELLQTIKIDNMSFSMSNLIFTNDEKYLIFSPFNYSGSVYIWDITKECLHHEYKNIMHIKEKSTIAVSSTNKLAIIDGSSKTLIFDIEIKKDIFKEKLFVNNFWEIHSLNFLRDSDTLLIGGNIRDVTSDKYEPFPKLMKFNFQKYTQVLNRFKNTFESLSQDKKNENKVVLQNLSYNGSYTKILTSHDKSIIFLVDRFNEHKVILIEAGTGRKLQEYAFNEEIRDAVINEEGTKLLIYLEGSGGDAMLKIIDIRNYEEINNDISFSNEGKTINLGVHPLYFYPKKDSLLFLIESNYDTSCITLYNYYQNKVIKRMRLPDLFLNEEAGENLRNAKIFNYLSYTIYDDKLFYIDNFTFKTLKVFDLVKEQEIYSLPLDHQVFKICRRDNFLAIGYENNEVAIFDVNTRQIVNIFQLPEKLHQYTSFSFSKDKAFLSCNYEANFKRNICIWQISTGKIVYSIDGVSLDGQILNTPFIAINDGDNIVIRNFYNQSIVNQIKKTEYFGKHFEHSGKHLIYGNYLIDLASGHFSRKLEEFQGSPYYFTSSPSTMIQYYRNRGWGADKEKEGLIKYDYINNDTLGVSKYKSQKKVGFTGEENGIISNSEKYIFTAKRNIFFDEKNSNDGKVKIWSTQSLKIIDKINVKEKIAHAKINKDNYQVVFITKTKDKTKDKLRNTLHYYTIKNQKLKFGFKQVLDVDIEDICFMNDNILLIAHSDFISRYDLNKQSIKQDYFAHIARPATITYNNKNQQLFAGLDNGEIWVWSYKNDTLITKLKGHEGNIVGLKTSGDDLFSIQKNGTVKQWNISTQKLIMSFHKLNGFKSPDYCFITPDNYYKISKSATNDIHFVRNLKSYPFEQFDVQYNRPDIILEKLGKAPRNTIQLYHKAYKNRLRKLNFKESMFSNDFHTPTLSILNKNEIKPVTRLSEIELSIEALDSLFTLNRLNVWVNNVPIWGRNGLSLKDDKKQFLSKKFKIILSEGKNKIQVSVFNEKAVESEKQTIYINYKSRVSTKPNLYILGIGAAQYKHMRALPGPDNDIRDFVKIYKTKEGELFNKVYIDTLINDKVRVDNITSYKEKLLNIDVNDLVIIYYSGHGFEDNGNYYLWSYLTKKKNLVSTSILYDELEYLLDGIPARNKLLILNSCNSGEYDKNMKEFKMMKETYPELRRGTGAIVIASSYSNEKSLAGSKKYEGNSLMGMVIKKILHPYRGELTIDELKKLIEKEVFFLSKERQRPTYRSENLELNFRIW